MTCPPDLDQPDELIIRERPSQSTDYNLKRRISADEANITRKINMLQSRENTLVDQIKIQESNQMGLRKLLQQIKIDQI